MLVCPALLTSTLARQAVRCVPTRHLGCQLTVSTLHRQHRVISPSACKLLWVSQLMQCLGAFHHCMQLSCQHTMGDQVLAL